MSDNTVDVDALLDTIVKPNEYRNIRRMLREAAAKKLHPIFEHSQWDDLSEADFLRILPALVFASELIVCCRAIHFWHALYYGRQEWEQQGSDGVTRRRFSTRYKTNVHLVPSEAKLIEKHIDELKLWTRFDFGDTLAGASGTTTPGHRGGPEGHPGVHCKIRVNIAKLKGLDLNQLPEAHIRYRRIDLAITLIHEVAHAAAFALHGPAEQAYFQDHIFAEMGFALEKWLFGGAIFLSRTEAGRMVLGHVQLPTTSMLNLYRANGQMPTTAELPSNSGAQGTVDDDWVDDWFRDEYWRGTIPQSVGRALRPRVIPRKVADLVFSEVL